MSDKLILIYFIDIDNKYRCRRFNYEIDACYFETTLETDDLPYWRYDRYPELPEE
jgi:hypothetical protein